MVDMPFRRLNTAAALMPLFVPDYRILMQDSYRKTSNAMAISYSVEASLNFCRDGLLLSYMQRVIN